MSTGWREQGGIAHTRLEGRIHRTSPNPLRPLPHSSVSRFKVHYRPDPDTTCHTKRQKKRQRSKRSLGHLGLTNELRRIIARPPSQKKEDITWVNKKNTLFIPTRLNVELLYLKANLVQPNQILRCNLGQRSCRDDGKC